MYMFCVSGMTHTSKAWKFKPEVYIKVVFVPKGTLLSIYTYTFDYCPKWDILISNKKCRNRLWNEVWKLLMELEGLQLKKEKRLPLLLFQ